MHNTTIQPRLLVFQTAELDREGEGPDGLVLESFTRHANFALAQCRPLILGDKACNAMPIARQLAHGGSANPPVYVAPTSSSSSESRVTDIFLRYCVLCPLRSRSGLCTDTGCGIGFTETDLNCQTCRVATLSLQVSKHTDSPSVVIVQWTQ